jgi:hypothetical protein
MLVATRQTVDLPAKCVAGLTDRVAVAIDDHREKEVLDDDVPLQPKVSFHQQLPQIPLCALTVGPSWC